MWLCMSEISEIEDNGLVAVLSIHQQSGDHDDPALLEKVFQELIKGTLLSIYQQDLSFTLLLEYMLIVF